MNDTLKIFAMLIGATLLFHTALNYMVDNIDDYETVALPSKKEPVSSTPSFNPVLKIDASSRDYWMLVDFVSGKVQRVPDADLEDGKLNRYKWDMGFQRTKIITNSGETNPSGKVGVINLGRINFDQVEEAPKTGYKQDSRAWGKLSNPSLSDWYIYRTRTHNVESQRNVYVVRNADHRFMKFRILNYYCSHQEAECATTMCAREEAGCLSIEYQIQPEGNDRFLIPPAKATDTMAQNSN
jgi:hypothetical protein